jgi:hypothetical protein
MKMAKTLYHGSVARIEQIDLSLANPKRDFGAGFYTTSSEDQAVRFCRLVAHRNGLAQGIVNSYSLADSDGLAILRFESASLKWLDFVLANRGFDHSASEGMMVADLIIGPVADDQVGRTLNLLMTGAYGDPHSEEARAFALSLLLPQKLTDQWVFKTSKAAERLQFLGAESYEL